MSMSETVVSPTITFKCAVHNALQYNPSSEAINISYLLLEYLLYNIREIFQTFKDFKTF